MRPWLHKRIIGLSLRPTKPLWRTRCLNNPNNLIPRLHSQWIRLSQISQMKNGWSLTLALIN
jgi:hypothetical protein